MSDAAVPRQSDRLWAFSLFAAVLSGAGLPIYLFAPKFFADSYGVSLSALGLLLLALRLVDVIQDPLLGWLSDAGRRWRARAIGAAALLLALSMWGLFGVTPPVAPLWWFGLTITGLFTAFSWMTINFYAQGVTKAGSLPGGHVQLAAWRESGALIGLCLAAVAPGALALAIDHPFAVFAASFAVLTLVAALAMAPEWHTQMATSAAPGAGFRPIVQDRAARRLLLLGFVNALPLAVSSTLFLFFVEYRLAAPGWEGPLLVVFFLSAAAAAPLWGALAQRIGARRTLLIAMVSAILCFSGVLTLGPGEIALFALICVVSGATMGADLTLVPAVFARRLARIAPQGGVGFGLWSLVSKLTLALAAAVLLPALDRIGLTNPSGPPDFALDRLTLLYGAVPCVLKLLSIALLSVTPIEDD